MLRHRFVQTVGKITLAFSVCASAIGIPFSTSTNGIQVAEAASEGLLAQSVGKLPDDPNPIMMQYFEWYLPNDGELWNRMGRDAAQLKAAGIDALWIPPAYKGGGSQDTGYGVYDTYDLGEFDQKGSTRTKYGFKDQLQRAIDELHKNDVSVYADVVLNHRCNEDGSENVRAIPVQKNNRLQDAGGERDIQAYTAFYFGGRGGKYSNFQFHSQHFTGNDPGGQIYRFTGPGKGWNKEVDPENGNYDFLMCADIDYNNPEVVSETKKWGDWFTSELKLDGYRLDAVKHIKFEFVEEWLNHVRKTSGKNLFSVGEYWSGNVDLLTNYINKTGGTTSMFDVPLHYNMFAVSRANGGYDMSKIFDKTLIATMPDKSITFVDNHDTQPGQMLFSFVGENFKLQAYTMIMTYDKGLPMVFYGDYYGNSGHGMKKWQDKIDLTMKARKLYAYGPQVDYIDGPDIIGWTRQGDSKRPGTGLATIVTDGQGGTKRMNVGKQHAGETWKDFLGNRQDRVVIGADGFGEFSVNERSASIWVQDGDVPKKPVVTTPDDDTPATKTPVTKTTPKAEPTATLNDSVTIYYDTNAGFKAPYAHYSMGNNVWTTAPGKAFSAADENGYAKLSISLSGAAGIDLAFNNGSNQWDSRNRLNYQFKAGEYTYIPGPNGSEGKIVPGAPKSNPVSEETPKPTAEKTAEPTLKPTVKPTVKPSAKPSVIPTQAVDPIDETSELTEITIGSEQVSQAIKSKSAVVLEEARGRIKMNAGALNLAKRSGLELVIGNVSMTLTAEMITSVLKGAQANKLATTALTLQVDVLTEEKKLRLWDQAKRLYEDAVVPHGDVYDFSLQLTTKQGDVYDIEQFEEPIMVQVRVPDGANQEVLGFYYINDRGQLEFVGANIANGVMTAMLMHFSQYGSFELYKTYSDVDADHFAAEAIQVLSAKHVVSGINTEEFAPEKSVTRAEFATILVRALGLQAAGDANYADVPSNAWYAKAVAAASSAGIVSGKGNNRFLPNAKITREELAVMVVRAYEGLTGESVEGAFNASLVDAKKVSSWARSYVNAAAELSLIDPAQNRFNPSKSSTRAEATKAIYELLKLTNLN